MLLSPDDCRLFFQLQFALLFRANRLLGINPDVDSLTDPSELTVEQARQIAVGVSRNLSVIDTVSDQLAVDFDDDELRILRSWKQQVAGKFIVLRQLKKHMIFLTMDDGDPIAYGVTGLSQPIEEICRTPLPHLVETILLPFRDQIIFDGLLHSTMVNFGSGYKNSFNEGYRKAKDRFGIVTSLPFNAETSTKGESTPAKKRKRKARGKDFPDALDSVVALTDAFCREYLDEECVRLCRELAEEIDAVDPTRLRRGMAKSWAGGIVRAIVLHNWLSDPNLQPNVEYEDIYRELNVGKSTAEGKATEIRKLITEKDQARWMHSTLQARFSNALSGFSGNDLNDEATLTAHQPVRSVDEVFQFKVTLNGPRPEIWRRIQVPDGTLHEFHLNIQAAMGWMDCHLYEFEINGVAYGDPGPGDMGITFDMGRENSHETRISQVVPAASNKKFRFDYTYDFGDNWEHKVLFEGRYQPDEKLNYPRCAKGARACPPEDCGGVWGFQEYLEAIADPRHERHKELLEWNGLYDPEEFDAEEATEEMQRVKWMMSQQK